MELNAYTLLLSFLVLLSHASSCNQSSAYPGLDEQVNLRRSEMLSKAQQNPSNAGKEDYISSATVAQDDAAITIQAKVLKVVTGNEKYSSIGNETAAKNVTSVQHNW